MRKLITIFLASLILAITMQLGLATHFCGGELAQAKMIYGHGEASCGMGCSIPPGNPNQQEPIFQKLSCCQDFIFTITVDDYQAVSQKPLFETHQILSPVIKSVNTPYIFAANTLNSSIPHSSIPPPHATEVLLTFIQVFLI